MAITVTFTIEDLDFLNLADGQKEEWLSNNGKHLQFALVEHGLNVLQDMAAMDDLPFLEDCLPFSED
jgi:hypothetical protein